MLAPLAHGVALLPDIYVAGEPSLFFGGGVILVSHPSELPCCLTSMWQVSHLSGDGESSRWVFLLGLPFIECPALPPEGRRPRRSSGRGHYWTTILQLRQAQCTLQELLGTLQRWERCGATSCQLHSCSGPCACFSCWLRPSSAPSCRSIWAD